LNICCDGFVHNCQVVTIFKAFVAGVMDGSTDFAFHKVV